MGLPGMGVGFAAGTGGVSGGALTGGTGQQPAAGASSLSEAPPTRGPSSEQSAGAPRAVADGGASRRARPRD